MSELEYAGILIPYPKKIVGEMTDIDKLEYRRQAIQPNKSPIGVHGRRLYYLLFAEMTASSEKDMRNAFGQNVRQHTTLDELLRYIRIAQFNSQVSEVAIAEYLHPVSVLREVQAPVPQPVHTSFPLPPSLTLPWSIKPLRQY